MTLDTFFKKFEQFADAPDAVAKMRELVLELAVQGKLVEQKHGDGNAKGIFTDRLPEKGERRCQIPATWLWIRFAVVGEQRLGKMLDQRGNRGDLKPYLRNTNVQWMRFELDDIKELRLAPDELEEFRLQPGDLLICEGGEPGRCAIWRDPHQEMYFQKAIHRVRPRKGILSEYLAICLQVDALNGVLAKQFTGATIKHFTGRSLREYSIPLPPLAEQKRIVAKVDELMALCDRLEAQQQERDKQASALARASLARFAEAPTPANLNLLFHKSYSITPADLRRCILTLAVQGRLVSSMGDTEIKPLGDILAEPSSNGISKGPTADTSATEVLRISAGTSRDDFYVDESDFKYVSLTAAEIKNATLRQGDLLACRYNGNLRFVGRFSLYRGESGRTQVNPDKLIRFRVDTARHDPRFVCFSMNSAATRAGIEAMCATTAGNIGLSAGRIKTVPLVLPPLLEQRRIVAKVEQLMALVDQLETQLAASRATAKNLLEAVVAELTSNDTVSSANGASHPSLGQRPRKSSAKAIKG